MICKHNKFQKRCDTVVLVTNYTSLPRILNKVVMEVTHLTVLFHLIRYGPRIIRSISFFGNSPED